MSSDSTLTRRWPLHDPSTCSACSPSVRRSPERPHDGAPARRFGRLSHIVSAAAAVPAAVGAVVAVVVFAVTIVLALPLLAARVVLRERRAAPTVPSHRADVLAAPLHGEAA